MLYIHAGRVLFYAWTLVDIIGVDVNKAVTFSNITNYLNENANKLNLPAVTLPASSMTPGLKYIFALKVKNFLSPMMSSSTVTVVKSSLPIPSLNVLGALYRTTVAKATNTFTAVGAVPTCNIGESGSSTKLVYEWGFVKSVPELASTVTFGPFIDPKVLTLLPYSLRAGYVYTFQARVYVFGRRDIMNVLNVDAEVVPDVLQAVIVGGDRQVGSDDDLLLDGSKSIDYDNVASLPMVYA